MDRYKYPTIEHTQNRAIEAAKRQPALEFVAINLFDKNITAVCF